jgi:hypothetical protein
MTYYAHVVDATHAPLVPPRVEEFAVRGLVVPAGGIAT